MIGLKRGTVELLPHQPDWEQSAAETIKTLKQLLGNTAVDIQHVGSTAIPSIHAKPIVDIALGLGDLGDIAPYVEALEQQGFLCRGADVEGQLLFVRGDLAQDTRSHHIHAVPWNGAAWQNYLNFRDYLRAFPQKARLYDELKQKLASQFPADRQRYTAGKQALIDQLLQEARSWREAGAALRALSWPEIQALYRSRMQEDFPQAELKPLWLLRRFFQQGLLQGYSLGSSGEQGLAYALLEAPQEGDVWLLDYLAVDKARRGQGWGSRCLSLLPGQLPGVKALVLEIERLDSAATEAEAQLRRQRKAFYLRCGVQETGVYTRAFGVDYEILALPIGGRLGPEEAAQAMERLYPRFYSGRQFQVFRPGE